MTTWYVRLYYTPDIFETFSPTNVYLDFTLDLSTTSEIEAYNRVKRLVERDRYFDINKPYNIEVCRDSYTSPHPKQKTSLVERWKEDTPFLTSNSPCSEVVIQDVDDEESLDYEVKKLIDRYVRKEVNRKLERQQKLEELKRREIVERERQREVFLGYWNRDPITGKQLELDLQDKIDVRKTVVNWDLPQ